MSKISLTATDFRNRLFDILNQTIKGGEFVIEKDGWTIRTEDGKPAGLFERSIEITKDKPRILTPSLD